MVSPRESALDRRLLGGMIGLVALMLAGGLFLPHNIVTPVGVVEGVYSNPCCTPIPIRQGAFVVGSQRVPFVLHQMKFGLEATPAANISVDQAGTVYAAATDDAHRDYIIFDDDRRGFTLLDARLREYHFRR